MLCRLASQIAIYYKILTSVFIFYNIITELSLNYGSVILVEYKVLKLSKPVFTITRLLNIINFKNSWFLIGTLYIIIKEAEKINI